MSKPKKKATHSPTPWEIRGATVIWSPSGSATVCAVSQPRATRYIEYVEAKPYDEGWEEATANADFIVHAVNNHDSLLVALMQFGHHAYSCNSRHSEQGDCDCGLTDAIKNATNGES